MKKIISCDWGISALRVRVIHTDKKTTLAEAVSDKGVLKTFNLWKECGRHEDERVFFYQAVLNAEIKKTEKQINISLQDVPVIISGMASSSIGMRELPYKEVPFDTTGCDLNISIIEATETFRYKSVLISGVKTGNDVMRGEETQLLGCLNRDIKNEQIFIFPGTHSKHVFIKNGGVVDFKTYMTGEFFELLAKKSILSGAVEKNEDISKSFGDGVTESLKSNLLHSSFQVWTNYLFKRSGMKENYQYLSGLLIGTEIKELINSSLPVTIVSNQLFAKYYSAALRITGINNFEIKDAGDAVVEGHCKIYKLNQSVL